MKQLAIKILKSILSNQKLLVLILLSIIFLLLTQIAFGQTTSKPTSDKEPLLQNRGNKLICIPASLADTIIHDLEERKMLLDQKKLYTQQNNLLVSKVDEFNTKNIELTKEISILQSDRNKWKTKARLRGWQRNGFIGAFLLLAFLTVK